MAQNSRDSPFKRRRTLNIVEKRDLGLWARVRNARDKPLLGRHATLWDLGLWAKEQHLEDGPKKEEGDPQLYYRQRLGTLGQGTRHKGQVISGKTCHLMRLGTLCQGTTLGGRSIERRGRSSTVLETETWDFGPGYETQRDKALVGRHATLWDLGLWAKEQNSRDSPFKRRRTLSIVRNRDLGLWARVRNTRDKPLMGKHTTLWDLGLCAKGQHLEVGP